MVLDSKQFERCFFNWIAAVSELTQGEIIPIDGKQLRRSHDREDGKAAIHLVSAWSSVNGLALGQVEVTDKSNEITAFPKLLEVLDISGCIVTIDAMGCQTEIAEKIVEAGGDYVLALKKNQGHLYEDVKLLFLGLQENPIADAYTDCDLDSVQTVEKDHGRIERRKGRRNNKTSHLIGPDYQIQTEVPSNCWIANPTGAIGIIILHQLPKALTLSGADCIASLRNALNFANLKTVVKVTAERE